MPTLRSAADLDRALASRRKRLLTHPLYGALRSAADVQRFMSHHVFAVWDFMSLLKALQRAVSCVDVPWVPRGEPVARRLINEIVVGEESDDLDGGGYASHFELYRAAMTQAGADAKPIDALIAALVAGKSIDDALAEPGIPPAARAFVAATFDVIRAGSTPRLFAAFSCGREDVIPDMFLTLVRELDGDTGGRFARFIDYLERHIRMDREKHGPMAAQALATTCGDDPAKWAEAERGAVAALDARLALWDAVAARPGARASG